MEQIVELIKSRDPEQYEFHQAVYEVVESVKPVLDRNPEYRQRPSWRGLPSRSGSFCFGCPG